MGSVFKALSKEHSSDQDPRGRSQLSVTPVLGTPMPTSGLHEYQAHITVEQWKFLVKVYIIFNLTAFLEARYLLKFFVRFLVLGNVQY